MCSVSKNEIEMGQFPNVRTIDSMEDEGKAHGENRRRTKDTPPTSSRALGWFCYSVASQTTVNTGSLKSGQRD